MQPARCTRKWNAFAPVAALAASALLAGCAGDVATVPAGPAFAAPKLTVGDRWVYQVVDGFRMKTEWDETHEIATVDPAGITVNVTRKGPTVDARRTEKWLSPGVVAEGAVCETENGRFDPPLVRYRFPLGAGAAWRQRVRNLDTPPGPFGPIVRDVRVRPSETVTTPAGTFDALRIDVLVTLDDETFWRWPTQCEHTIWYAESVGASVRERVRSYWYDKGDRAAAIYHPGLNTSVELASFSRR